MSNCVPGAICPAGITPPTNRLTAALSPALNPARASIPFKVSPWPSVATNCTRLRSGMAAARMTAAVGAIWRPLSAPSASGWIIWLRNSSRATESSGMAGGADSALASGHSASAARISPNIVARPRNQRRLPIASARSGAQSTCARSSASSRAIKAAGAAGAGAAGAVIGTPASAAGLACPNSGNARGLNTSYPLRANSAR